MLNYKQIQESYESAGAQLGFVGDGAISYCIFMRALQSGYPERTAGMGEWVDEVEVAARAHLLEELRRRAPLGTVQEVPRVRFSDFGADDFTAYMQRPVPLILDGAAAQSKAVRGWTPGLFGDRYGYLECTLARQKGEAQKRGTLAEVAEAIAHERFDGWYAHNIANVFHNHPELVDDLAIGDIATPFGGLHFLTQLFFGGPGTRTDYHCANHFNVFVNVYGEKEWTFAHPRYTPLFYAKIDASGIYTSSPVDFTKSPEEQADEFPLYAYAPLFKCRLRPGDVLLNPPWWWHGVLNTTSATIACATRHLVPPNFHYNPVLEAASFLMPHLHKLETMVSNDPNLKITDELTRDAY